MKYNAPYGSADPNAPYIDRNTPGAISGSRVPAVAIELPQREIVHVIATAGLTPDNADPTQLYQALALLIAAAGGGGDVEDYVLMGQLRARMPVYPEVETADAKIPVVSPSSGQVRIPAGYSFVHRGVFLVTTVQVDFVTAANKTYHVRWSPTGGYVLKDLADAGYNAGAVAETNSQFDSTYDDMLIARVVTSGTNVPTVVPLANKHNLTANSILIGADLRSSGGNGANALIETTINWARTPTNKTLIPFRTPATLSGSDIDANIYAPTENRDANGRSYNTVLPLTRYGLSVVYMRDGMDAAPRMLFDARA